MANMEPICKANWRGLGGGGACNIHFPLISPSFHAESILPISVIGSPSIYTDNDLFDRKENNRVRPIRYSIICFTCFSLNCSAGNWQSGIGICNSTTNINSTLLQLLLMAMVRKMSPCYYSIQNYESQEYHKPYQ